MIQSVMSDKSALKMDLNRRRKQMSTEQIYLDGSERL